MRVPAIILLTASLASAQNALTPNEVAEGWILLFDGGSTFGWTEEGAARWTAGGGVLTPSGGSGWLRSNAAFGDFVLKCDYRTGAEGNSGLFLRSARHGAPHETGYELQIWNQHPKFPTGSLVNHMAGKKVQPAPDQWHAYEIAVQGDHWTIKLDGTEVLDGRDAKSKVGHVGLQYNEGKSIQFRNIKLKPLGARPLFDGNSLAGWREVDAPRPKEKPVWTVRDGAIHVEKGPGQLESEAAFDDFVLQLDIRTNPKDANHHPNSGVFFRGQKGQFWSGYEAQIRNEYKDGDRAQPVDFGTGAIYNRQAARKVVPDDGRYFVMTVAARGRNIDVWVDGYPVTSWEDSRPEGINARREARLVAGVLSLQAHDPTTNLDFRNIRIAPMAK